MDGGDKPGAARSGSQMLHVVQEDRSPYWLKDTEVRVTLYVKPLIF